MLSASDLSPRSWAGGEPRRRARPSPRQPSFGGLEADALSSGELVADLAALVEAGLVAPIRDGDVVRYAVVEDAERQAQP